MDAHRPPPLDSPRLRAPRDRLRGHGDSGGPFVDEGGRLVGVLLKKDGNEGEGHTFYMPVDTALTALNYR